MGAVDEISASAGLASPVLAAEEADSHALADLPLRQLVLDCLWTNGIDATHDLMPWNTRKGQPGKFPFNGRAIRMANATRLHAKSHLPGPGLDEGTNGLGELTGSRDFKSLVSCSRFVFHSWCGAGWAGNYG